MKTILVADDEEHLRLLVRKTLETEDYRILEAENGREAIELARKERPDLLILDWMMPEVPGIEALRTLREEAETTATPVVMLTAKSQQIDRNQALRLGVRGYLVKPFSPLALIHLVERVLEGVRE